MLLVGEAGECTMTSNTWNVAIIGFPLVQAKRMGMVLAEKIKNHPQFIYQSDWEDAPCDAVVIDSAEREAKAELLRLRKLWPGAVTVWISDSGTVGESGFKLERAHLFAKLRPVLERALEESAIAGGQMPDQKLVPEAKYGRINAAEPLSALVVDDSSTVRQQITGALQRLGILAEEAAGGGLAATKAKLKKYDLYLVDIEMPEIDGYGFIKKLREIPDRQDSPVIILTSRSSAIDKLRSALAGSASFLSKPVNLKDLYSAIDAVLMKAVDGKRERLTARGYRLD